MCIRIYQILRLVPQELELDLWAGVAFFEGTSSLRPHTLVA